MNKYRKHIYVIPEDAATEEIANGFILDDRVDQHRVQVMSLPVGGWNHVLATFEREYVNLLRRFPLGHVVLLIDFDHQGDERMGRCRESIPDDLRDRVFVVGPSREVEDLKAALELSREEIGRRLAEDCATAKGGGSLWEHEQLRHNDPERRRLAGAVWEFVRRPSGLAG